MRSRGERGLRYLLGDEPRAQANGAPGRGAERGRGAGQRADLHELQRREPGAQPRASSLRQAQPGRSYQLTGTVVHGSVHREGAVLRLQPSQDRVGGTAIPLAYTGTVPDPFREGREVIVTVAEAGRRVRRRTQLADHQVPVEVQDRSAEREAELLSARCPCRAPPARPVGADGRSRASPACCWRSPCARTASARRCTACAAGASSSRTPAGARSTRWPAILTVAFAVLEIAFLRNDFAFNTVADTSSRTTPALYRAAAVWSSQEGSLLLWAWLLSLWSSLALFLTRKRMRDVAAYATAILLGFGGFFISLMIFYANPVRDDHPGAGRRRRARSAAALPDDDDPPADAVLGLHAVHDPAGLRHGRAARAPSGRRLDQGDPPLRVRRLAVPRDRHPARRALVLLGARLGRLLGLGRRRERLADAVADGHRVPALADDPGEARDAEGLERLARARHRHARDHGHVPRAQRGPQLDPRLRRRDARRAVRRADRRADRGLDLPRRLAPRHAALRAPARLAALARVDLPRQQPRARRAVLRDLLGHLLPADLRGAHRSAKPRSGRRGSTATRSRWRWCSCC